jgi:hypothetical protein
MQYPSFQVGQVVVCIDDDGLPIPLHDDEVARECPREGSVYTIRDVLRVQKHVGLLLEEIRNPPVQWKCGDLRELAFFARRFRPAKTTSIETFKAMLAPVLEPA